MARKNAIPILLSMMAAGALSLGPMGVASAEAALPVPNGVVLGQPYPPLPNLHANVHQTIRQEQAQSHRQQGRQHQRNRQHNRNGSWSSSGNCSPSCGGCGGCQAKGELPMTGAPMAALATVGGGLLAAAAAGLVLTARRRRSTHAGR